MRKLSDKNILVIDDNTGMLRALKRVLSGEGASVTTASWAGDAVDILTAREQAYDLVITDLRMPFVTGLTVVFAVCKIYPELPIIVLSAFGSPEVKEECFRQGAAAFLEKPLNTEELMAVVEKVFAQDGSLRAGSDPLQLDFSKERKDGTELSRLEIGQRSSSGCDHGVPVADELFSRPKKGACHES